MSKVLALNEKGQLTYCIVPPEERGRGRCNHKLHQEDGESNQDFVERVNQHSDYGDRFIDEGNKESKEVEFQQYKMSEEEKSELVMIMGRKDLERNIEGGVIELKEPLWNDMDKSSYSTLTGTSVSNIDAVLNREKYIIEDIDDDIQGKNKIGQIVTENMHEKLLNKHGDKITFNTGVEGMNSTAIKFNFEATKDVYVLPYYLRQDPPGTDAKNPINTLYNYLIVKRKDPDVQQQAYNSLLNNSKAKKPITQKGGYPIDSLAEKFKGKSGVMRSVMSGRRIVNSGRAVITPDHEMDYGTIKVPPMMAAKMYGDTIKDRLQQEGEDPEKIDKFLDSFRGQDQNDVPKEDSAKLNRVVNEMGVKAVVNRQPSLHFSSLLSFKPEVSSDSTIKVNPLNLPGYAGDFDGDTMSVYGINDPYIANKPKDMDPAGTYGTRMPRSQNDVITKPTKESLWGLYNILSKRS